jgi:phosphoenolpyruvate-protein phosphotransferase (PTS system enzyme I)
MSFILSGIGVSRGIAIGKAHVLQQDALEVRELHIAADEVEQEVRRYEQAVDVASQQLRAIRDQIPEATRKDIVDFIDTHLLMLQDSTLVQVPAQSIREQQCNAEWALKLQQEALAAVFDEMDDPYLRTRKDDVNHVIHRILRILVSGAQDHGDTSIDLEGTIVFASDLTPSDTVLLHHQGVAAFVTEFGGPLSHTAILARSLGIPAIVGMHSARRYIQDGETIILDGEQGLVLAGADTGLLDHYRRLQEAESDRRENLTRLKDTAAITRDGVRVQLLSNIELPEDMERTLAVGAEGIGLYRTEFLFMNRPDIPSEEEQLEQYRAVIQAMEGLPVTIRTLDLGADKKVDNGPLPGRSSSNPALGLRAIRLCLKDLDLFRPQLRAILRASAAGPTRIMIPMLSNLQEIGQVLSLLEETKEQLRAEGHAFDPHLPIGGMIEIPAAALTAPCFAAKLDFLSIGTNDLIQYTLAIDRIDDEVAYLYDPLHPAVLRLIQLTIQAGLAAGIPVSMCGEMAGDPRFTRLLLGMGLTQFSMYPTSILEVKDRITRSSMREAQQQVESIIACNDLQEIHGRLDGLNRGNQEPV